MKEVCFWYYPTWAGDVCVHTTAASRAQTRKVMRKRVLCDCAFSFVRPLSFLSFIITSFHLQRRCGDVVNIYVYIYIHLELVKRAYRRPRHARDPTRPVKLLPVMVVERRVTCGTALTERLPTRSGAAWKSCTESRIEWRSLASLKSDSTRRSCQS